jgi:Protein of unknown function (Hypoth_ymh)
MDDALAHKRLSEVLDLIDRYDETYDRRWGLGGFGENPSLDQRLRELEDQVRGQTRFARDLVAAMGEKELAAKVEEHHEVMDHWFKQARKAIVEAIAILTHREELAAITGPVGPRLSASELHQVIWGSAAPLWDDGHYRSAVHAAGGALEAKLQAVSGPGVSGQDLAILFSLKDPTPESPRLRLRDIDTDPASKTRTSAHEGAAFLVRGAFMGVRNLVSHPGWPEPDASDALEMLAVLSYVAHLVDRCDVERAK